ncbi:MAG: Holliday junction DNA helicase RuvB C-terminal domain-containing protein [Chloroflexota bacterium]
MLLDQVGALEPRGVAAQTRAVIGPGALVRVNLRRDIGSALVLQEARVGRQSQDSSGFAGPLLRAVLGVEELSLKDAGTSHLQFQPNQLALGQRLDRALFVAATSNQVDPSCFIRGVRALDSYLWDYEVPGTPGYDATRAGYYLVAKPSRSMKDSVLNTTRLVTNSPPAVESLLDEISKRGIPVLKRMARGGGQSRGELGVLLAVRLLQDAFRTDAGPIRLAVANETCIHLILPVDSYWNPFVQLRRSLQTGSSEERPDLLIFAMALSSGGIRLKVTPIEVKFRESSLAAVEMGLALQQASNLGGLLTQLWAQPPPNELWTTCAKALLAQCLDHAFRVYADPQVHGRSPDEWASWHETVLQQVLGATSLETVVTVNTKGRLLVFDASTETDVVDVDGDGRGDTAIISRDDATKLLVGNSILSDRGEQVVSLLDLSLPECASGKGTPTPGGPPAPPSPTQAAQPESPEEAIEPATYSDSSEDGGADSDSPAAATVSAVPVEVRQQVRAAFHGFIGNEAAIKRITNDLLRALIERPPYLSKNYLLTGQPSTGKTEVARRMAVALQLPFVRLDGRTVPNRDRLFDLVNGELLQQGRSPEQVGQQSGLPVLQYPSLVVFVDEVHLLPRAVQESLLTMLEANDRTVTLTSQVARVDRATFIFATTRASDVDAAFRSRCTEVQLHEYELSEVAAIVEQRFPGWPRDIYMEVAKLGRRVPRVALELARELETEMTVSEHPTRPVFEHLEEVRKAREVDHRGLTRLDLEYLGLLVREARPLGEQPLSNMLGTVDRDRIVDEVEPFLARLGFIKLGARGREITPEGQEYWVERQRAT